MHNVIVGMSGGVDSSVSAYLLQQQGYKVSGLFMKNWEDDDTETHCSASVDRADAQAVCDRLNIPLHTINFATEYWEHVFTHFLSEYAAGRTPNPDILCNKYIKFKAFLNYARELGADFIATGHYARCEEKNGGFYLLKGKDAAKDQSYFLHLLDQNALRYTLFPLGNLTKTQTRAIAARLGLPNADKKDSTGICFIGERKFKTFLQNYLPAQAGAIVTLEGEMLGTHEGLMYYTLGQRQGLKIGGLKNKPEKPWYVVKKDLATATLYVTQGDNKALYANTLIATQLHWIHEAPAFPLHCHAKIRYRQADQCAHINLLDNKQCAVNFDTPQRAITPGQSIVFYQDDICLGGGIIEQRGQV